MRKSIKAALLSALVFPGLGHYFLKKYIAAAAFAGIAFFLLYRLMKSAAEWSMIISDKIISGEMPPDAASIAALTSTAEGGGLNSLTMVFVIVWLAAIVDSYRLGRRQD